jgi:DNA-binding IclR family transcriptional regulator
MPLGRGDRESDDRRRASRAWVFTVKQGADFRLSAHRVSARVLTAFAVRARQDEMLQAMSFRIERQSSSALRKRLNGIARKGYDMVLSETIGGVIDLAFPVFDQDGYAKASLVVPLLPVIGRGPDPETVKAKVAEAAQQVSAAIGDAVAVP